MPPLLTRRNFFLGLAGGVVTAAGAGSYLRWLEPGWLDVTRTVVALPERLREPGAPPLRVLHLSDLHAYAPWITLDHIAHAVALGLAQKPDLVCLTGDFITRRYEAFGDYARVLRPLAVAAPTFACLGNHDGGAWARGDGGYAQVDSVSGLLKNAGIDLVHNSVRSLMVGGRRVQLFGVGDWWAGQCLPGRAFAVTPSRTRAVRLVLSHNPDAKGSLVRYDWDVMLCGHTHGGQIGIPALARRFAPVRDKRFIAGLYKWEGRQLFITRGIGNLHHARFLCRPEVSVLELS